ncbi:MAG: hybrid sensor histidine kinase/response regulator [Caulobacteraceae bacterium]
MSDAASPVNFLLVDDLQENLLALEALLKREDLVCLKARSGEEALELLLEHEIALALLDVQMPGMNGYELAEFMRGNARAKHIPIIFLTAGTTDSQRRFRGYEAGAVDFIQKPIEPDVLRGKAAVFFDLYQQRQKIQTQRDELSAYADRLKATDQYKTEFIAMLGHELRNPIMALTSGLTLLKRRRDPDFVLDIHERMERQVAHMTRLIEDLLDISRIGQGKIYLKPELSDLVAILEAAVESSQLHIDNAGHRLDVEIPKGPIWLTADPTRLAQVISNLLNNAAKYTPKGGRIGLTAHQNGLSAEIAVSDNGMGIPAAKQAQIFEIFAQVQSHGAATQSGLGIGLALVKQLVELHGGTIRVQSEGPGKGSTFTVTLPLLAAGSAAAAARSAQS